MNLSSGIFRLTAIVVLTASLPGCALFEPQTQAKHTHTKHAKPAKSAKTTVTATALAPGSFVQQLALAQLGLPQEADDTSVIAANLEALQTYSAQQPVTPQRQQVVILTLKPQKGAAVHQIIVPAAMTVETTVFPPLLEIMNRLATMPYRLQDIRLSTVTVAPEALSLPDSGATDTRQILAEQEKLLLDSAEKPAPLEEAQHTLPLIRFFISHHFRDGAYLCADNVKRLLAEAPHADPQDEAVIKSLSQQLDALENQMRKTMPYTLSN